MTKLSVTPDLFQGCMVVFTAFKALGFFVLEALHSLLSVEGLCVGGEWAVAETCRQQGECEPDMPPLNSYFWLLTTRTPGLQCEKKKKERHRVEGIEALSDSAKDPICPICTLQ